MKYLSKSDIEGIAERVLKAYYKLPSVNDKRIYRIEPEKIICELLNDKLEFYHLSLDASVLGLTASCENYVKIYNYADELRYSYIDKTMVFVEVDLKNDISQFGRYNFTVAHEASHKVLQLLYPEEYCQQPFVSPLHYNKAITEKTDNLTKWLEWQANALASALLMPKFLLEQAMYLCCWDKQWKIVNKKYTQNVYAVFESIAGLLGVSKEALGYRMIELGYIDELYLNDCNSMIMVNKDEE